MESELDVPVIVSEENVDPVVNPDVLVKVMKVPTCPDGPEGPDGPDGPLGPDGPEILLDCP